MSKVPSNQDEVAPLGFGLSPEDAEEMGDPWSGFCRHCGACVNGCLAAKFGSGFDPRQIMLAVRYGLADRLLREYSVLWQCFQCNGCYERCPLPLKPAEVIAGLRELLPEVVRRSEGVSQAE